MTVHAIQNDVCHEVLTSIRKIIRAVDIHSKRLRMEVGVTAPQLIVLKEIHNNKRITTTALAEHISLSQSTVTNILDRLVDKNLVVRIRDSVDKRMWFLELTESGVAVVGNSPSLLQKDFIVNFSNLPEWQQTQMLSTLQRIAAMMCYYNEEHEQQDNKSEIE